MKKYYAILITILLCSCSKQNDNQSEERSTKNERKNEFKTIFDSANLQGSILIYDLNKDTYYSNDFDWASKGHLPASTFKIPNSIIALETGVVKDDSTLFKWDGEKRFLRSWERDLIFKEAFHASCVPCYQEVARKIGAERMNQYLSKFDYGTMRLDSTSIDNFWLEGGSQITQFEQIDFLKRFYLSELNISQRTDTLMKKLMVMEETDDYVLRGKTGWAIRDEENNGWFVGYLETNNNVHFFATNVAPKPAFDMDQFAKIRKTLTLEGLRELELVE